MKLGKYIFLACFSQRPKIFLFLPNKSYIIRIFLFVNVVYFVGLYEIKSIKWRSKKL